MDYPTRPNDLDWVPVIIVRRPGGVDCEAAQLFSEVNLPIREYVGVASIAELILRVRSPIS